MASIQNQIYQATVTRENNGEEKTYVGITEGTFKTRFHKTRQLLQKSETQTRY